MPTGPNDAARALKYGAKGIGLCRTERMFNAVERLPVVIEMIVAEDQAQRQAALDKLLPMQRADFKGLFEVMSPLPVTIRLLDPPIHEFLPTERQLQSDLEQLSHLRRSVLGMEVLAGSMILLHDPSAAKSEADSMRHIVDLELVEQAIEKKTLMLEKGACAYRGEPDARPSWRTPWHHLS